MSATCNIGDTEKREAMEQVLQSATFLRASQVRNFLRYICEMELAGRASALHEYLIAVEAMGLPSSYSTDDDSSVRRRAYALRQKLETRVRERADGGQGPHRGAEGQLRAALRARYLNRRGSMA